MNAKLATPDLDSLDDEPTRSPESAGRPDLRGSFRRPEPRVDQLVGPGFVTEAALPEPIEPDGLERRRIISDVRRWPVTVASPPMGAP